MTNPDPEYEAALEELKLWRTGDLVRVAGHRGDGTVLEGALGHVVSSEINPWGKYSVTCVVDFGGVEAHLLQDDLVEASVLERLADEA